MSEGVMICGCSDVPCSENREIEDDGTRTCGDCGARCHPWQGTEKDIAE